MNTKVLSIREYVHQLDWDNICKIHDNARLIELEGSVTKKAFVPLINCYKDEELFKSTIFIGEVENKTIGFVAFDKHEITWLYVDPKFFGNGYGRRLLDFVIDKALSTVITGNPKKQLPEFAKWRLFSTDSLDPVERKLSRLIQNSPLSM